MSPSPPAWGQRGVGAARTGQVLLCWLEAPSHPHVHTWWPLGALSPAAPCTLLTSSVDTLRSFKASVFMNWSFLLLFTYQFFARELPFLHRWICPLSTCFVLLRDYIDVFVPLFTDVL